MRTLLWFLPACAAACVKTEILHSLTNSAGSSVGIDIAGHTKLHVRRVDSTAWCAHGQRVPCYSLTNIEVNKNFRRQGHARATLHALHKVAEQQRRILLVENVVSDHMHKLVSDLNGEPLPGSRAGRRGAHYWVPPRSGMSFADMAIG